MDRLVRKRADNQTFERIRLLLNVERTFFFFFKLKEFMTLIKRKISFFITLNIIGFTTLLLSL